ncbi:hypothetical protein J437_LFUL018488 [Ladona fulva]|uniref:CCHC-type domain-containing protein n=1 Tax=Ladona fulva TaxID=123851 RepID=A0A8K0K132_LADFU|nr:hypothetical protein J437_LFUL018488 [Ladona fulva]
MEAEIWKGKYEESTRVPRDRIKTTSFADAVKKGKAGEVAKGVESVMNVTLPEQKIIRHKVLITPNDSADTISADEIKDILNNKSKPSIPSLKVYGIRKDRNRGIIAETSSEKDVKCLKECGQLGTNGLRVKESDEFKRQIIIFNVDERWKERDLELDIVNRNFDIDFTKEREDVEIVVAKRKFNCQTKGKVNWIVEISRKYLDQIKDNNRIFIGWEAYKYKRYVNVTRCLKCYGLGHTHLECKSKEIICGHCGESGHIYKDCPKKESSPMCINCKKAGNDFKHSTRDKIAQST